MVLISLHNVSKMHPKINHYGGAMPRRSKKRVKIEQALEHGISEVNYYLEDLDALDDTFQLKTYKHLWQNIEETARGVLEVFSDLEDSSNKQKLQDL